MSGPAIVEYGSTEERLRAVVYQRLSTLRFLRRVEQPRETLNEHLDFIIRTLEEALRASWVREMEREQMAAIRWLEERWGERPPCVHCKASEYTVSAPYELLADGYKLKPMFMVTCSNCGATTFVDAAEAEAS